MQNTFKIDELTIEIDKVNCGKSFDYVGLCSYVRRVEFNTRSKHDMKSYSRIRRAIELLCERNNISIDQVKDNVAEFKKAGCGIRAIYLHKRRMPSILKPDNKMPTNEFNEDSGYFQGVIAVRLVENLSENPEFKYEISYSPYIAYLFNDKKDKKIKAITNNCDEFADKSVPKKPNVTIYNCFCPNCKEAFGKKRIEEESLSGFKWFQYCPYCGQKLDWGNYE